MSQNLAERELVLVVDDDPSLCQLVTRWLDRAVGQARAFPSGEACLAALAENLPDCVCLDLNMPGLSGLQTLERIKARHPHLPVIVLTAEEEVTTVVATMQAGAYDYLVKPLDRTKLVTTVQRALEQHQLRQRVRSLEREVEGRGYRQLIGHSATMKELYRQMDRLAVSDITVLIHGESGTGKELIARSVHDYSSRSEESFVAVNCAAIPESLEESEFFGHEKGAFTGAANRRQGWVEQAHQGTLFLDEVGELSLGLQAKLLRVLQERRFLRVGGTAELVSDFRLVAATHRNLEQEVQAGRFREDLFFRIAVYELEVPPLRDREGDIRLLARHFVSNLAAAAPGAQTSGLSPAAVGTLEAYAWPGNVRELQNAIERAGVMAQGRPIEPRDLPERIHRSNGAVAAPNPPQLGEATQPSAVPSNGAVPSTSGTAPADPSQAPADMPIRTLDELEKEAILAALERTEGNLSEVVRQLGIGRTTLYRKLQRYGLR